MITIDSKFLTKYLTQHEIDDYTKKAQHVNKLLETSSGKGKEFLGWKSLPSAITSCELDDISTCAHNLTKNVDVVVVVGIGGSYLGSKAVIEALSNPFSAWEHRRNKPLIVFAGHHLDEDYHHDLMKFLSDKSVACIVISKSGTTTEPAIAFRLLKKFIENKYGKVEAQKRIIAITDKNRGALRKMSDLEGYKTFVIADDIGGRFSVLSPVGLLPIACAGFNIHTLVKGAAKMLQLCEENKDFKNNPVLQYAILRNALYAKGKKIELLANYNPRLQYFGEWWKQLFGESEGKEHKGIFNAAVSFTTDLHSLGQYIQDGERSLFETVISVGEPDKTLTIPKEEDNFDNLNYLAGLRLHKVNATAELATNLAHTDGGVPVIRIQIDKLQEETLGELIYFFERACALSGYMIDVNPFDQEGVEAYKNNMFALLEKPGFETATKTIKTHLKDYV